MNDFLISDPSSSYVTELGKDVRIPFNSVLKCPRITIGDYTRINGEVNIRGKSNCRIGKYCAFGYGIHIITTNHATNHANVQIALNRKYGFVNLEKEKKPVQIGNNVWIGDSVTILAGANIGDGAVIGAGSVVTKNIPPFSIAYGVPASVMSQRFPKSICNRLLEIKWWDWSQEKIKNNAEFFNLDLNNTEIDLLNKVIRE